MRQRIACYTQYLVIASILIVGCSSQKYNPDFWHQNFLHQLQNNVGYFFAGGWARHEELIEQIELPSGYIAYKYRYIRTCRYILEVDPKRNIIVRVAWEGDKHDCIIVP